MNTKHTKKQSIDEAARHLVSLRRLARLERKEFGAVSAGLQRKIAEAIAAATAVCAIDDARTAIAKAEGGAA